MAYDAVLMLGFGGPGSMKEVLPFVMNVVRGRPVPPERIEQVVDQYRQIGGRSPFRELTRRQAGALAAVLGERGHRLPVQVGLLYSAPYICDAIERLAAEGGRKVVAVVMAPHRTEASFDRYARAVEASVGKLDRPLAVEFVEPWHQHPLFVGAVADRVSEAFQRLDQPAREQSQLIFTAHSVPEEMSDRSGYAQQVSESAELVARSIGHENWRVAFQSRSGSATHNWLEPDVRDVLAEAASHGVTSVIVVPIGFVCDHVEVLYDLDVQAAAVATEHGIKMVRAATVGDHPGFIALLADLVMAVAVSEEAREGAGSQQ